MPTYDVGYTNPGGITVPAATSTDDMPHHWQGMFDGSNGGGNLNAQTTPTFASVSALTAKYTSYPDDQKPALAKVTGLGWYQWVPAPYGIWIPALGSVNLLHAPTRSVTTLTAGSAGTTEQLVISVPAWPLLVQVTYRARVSQSGGATLANTYLNVNGSADAYQAVSSFPDGKSVTEFYQVPGTAQGGSSTWFVQGGLEYVSGAASSSVSVDGTDTARTRVSAVVSPYYANVGGTPF